MKLKTRTRYGLRLMIELAAQDGKDPVLLRNISKSQDISIKYLSQIAVDLHAARLISATRGPHGGFHLARPAEEITAYDVVAALEKDLNLVDCTRGTKRCRRESKCVSQGVWEKLSQAMTNCLQNIRLSDLVAEQREKARQVVMFDI